MSFPSVCRVCLCSNRRMKIIENTKLQILFEKLTSNQLITTDGKPTSVCYLCYLHLEKCSKFVEMSRRAEIFLSCFIGSGARPSQERLISNCLTLRHDTLNLYSQTSETIISIPNCDDDDKTREVKVEPVEREYEVEIDPGNTSATEDFNENDSIENRLYQKKTPKVGTDSTKKKVNKSEKEDLKQTIKPEKKNNLKKNKIKQKGYECTICSKIYQQKGYLKRHIRLHTGETPYTCTECGEKFSDSVIFKQHTRVHSGEGPYVCHVCTKPFNQKPHLIEHMRTHTGEKPYACMYCADTFAHKGSLIRHERTHTGDKPYSCDKCSKSFTQISNLQKHSRTCKVGRKKHVCLQCFDTL